MAISDNIREKWERGAETAQVKVKEGQPIPDLLRHATEQHAYYSGMISSLHDTLREQEETCRL